FHFFFQAEDGIRDSSVTGVQTCALPICLSPYASPLRAASLADVPPAYIITTGFDPPKSEGEAYATRLRDAGVPTTLRDYPGLLRSEERRVGKARSSRRRGAS